MEKRRLAKPLKFNSFASRLLISKLKALAGGGETRVGVAALRLDLDGADRFSAPTESLLVRLFYLFFFPASKLAQVNGIENNVSPVRTTTASLAGTLRGDCSLRKPSPIDLPGKDVGP